MSERRKPILGEQIGLLVASGDCTVLGRVLRELSVPTSVAKVRALALEQVVSDIANGVPSLNNINGGTLSLGLRRMKRFGMAAYKNRKWGLTEQGRKAVDQAFIPFSSRPS